MTATALPAGRRELLRDHIAFYRAVMEGVDVRCAWDRYLGIDGDFSDTLAGATLFWIRQTLIHEAMAAGQPGLIGLFRRDPQRIRANTRPSLDEFAARLDDAGAWSEAELTELWEREYGGPDRVEARRARLSRRLREALALLERAERRAPRPDDRVAQWLAPALAARLEAVGLATLATVRAALAARRTPRWEAVPGIGEVWADRLQAWFDEHGIHAPAAPPATPSPLVPLERFAITDAGPGSQVVLPAESSTQAPPSSPYPCNNALGAENDRHAIELWLAARAGNANTHRAYRRNAERLLLWCYLERRASFPTLTVADCVHYRAWLGDLGRRTPAEWAAAGWRIPAEQWIGPRAARRDSPEWRPFDGPLAPASIAQELLNVRSLFEFLLRGRVVAVNPWDLLGKRPVARARLADATEQFVGRSFTEWQWNAIVGELDPAGPELERRLLLVLWLGFACGLRAAEMLSLTLGSLVPAHDAWRLRVIGKDGKRRVVPLPSPARQALLAYLESIGLPFDAVVGAALAGEGSRESDAPLLRSRRGRRRAGGPAPIEPLRYTRLYGLLKNHLRACADTLGARDVVAAAKLRAASTHWLRHTCATLALKDGVALNAVQRLLGHSSLNVTSTYVTAQDEALQSAMETFAARAALSPDRG